MKIAITAPAGPVDSAKLSKGIARLNDLGYAEIVVGETCKGSHFWNSAPAEKRAAEFEAFWRDDEIDLVLAARGGFGCIHLLDLLNWGKLAQHKKILCGHSDLTVMHLAFAKYGVSRSVSGIMPAVEFADKGFDELSLLTFRQSLEKNFNFELQGSAVRKGSVKGRLMPVTLSVLCSLLGTGHLPSFDDAILCIEDVNEPAYRLDAYLSQLELCGAFEKSAGLIWGDFSDCGTDIEQNHLIDKYSGKVKGPVVKHVKFGHCLPRISLPFGNKVIFKVNELTTIESLDS